MNTLQKRERERDRETETEGETKRGKEGVKVETKQGYDVKDYHIFLRGHRKQTLFFVWIKI